MTLAHISKPGTADAEYIVTNREIIDQIDPEGKRKPALTRFAAATGVEQRRYHRRLSEVAHTTPFEESNDPAVEGVIDLATRAAQSALDNAGLAPERVARIVTAHVTGQMVTPGLDAHLINALGLRPTVRCTPMTELACAGGAHALGLAADLVQPNRPVLFSSGEVLTSAWQNSNDRPQDAAFKLLFGDGGGAAVLSHPSDSLMGVGAAIEESWEYMLPNSLRYYYGYNDTKGMNFTSEKESLKGVGDVVPEMPWMGDDWNPEFGVLHPGSALILDKMVEAGAVSEETTRHSRAVLAEYGNTGGPTALRVLERWHREPPRRGAEGLLFGVGPGFRACASRLRWIGE
ncbi:hypothetical protein [Streptomyces catenulae]|uniref:PhlD n=1 Tax=Streptomyces catenulae TaxID=66875 RepID=A0ABV2Z7Z5_9ACTN|nr:hypothetical protein [Streptomyces catenulae]